jgi:cation transporter-like permease
LNSQYPSGYQRDPYIAVVIYSVVCTVLYLLKQYRGVLALFGNAPTKGVGFALVPSFLLSVVTTVFLPFLVAQTVAFYAVRGFIS